MSPFKTTNIGTLDAITDVVLQNVEGTIDAQNELRVRCLGSDLTMVMRGNMLMIAALMPHQARSSDHFGDMTVELYGGYTRANASPTLISELVAVLPNVRVVRAKGGAKARALFPSAPHATYVFHAEHDSMIDVSLASPATAREIHLHSLYGARVGLNGSVCTGLVSVHTLLRGRCDVAASLAVARLDLSATSEGTAVSVTGSGCVAMLSCTMDERARLTIGPLALFERAHVAVAAGAVVESQALCDELTLVASDYGEVSGGHAYVKLKVQCEEYGTVKVSHQPDAIVAKKHCASRRVVYEEADRRAERTQLEERHPRGEVAAMFTQ